MTDMIIKYWLLITSLQASQHTHNLHKWTVLHAALCSQFLHAIFINIV